MSAVARDELERAMTAVAGVDHALPVFLVADVGQTGDARDAIAAMGGCIVGEVDWHDVATVHLPRDPVLIVVEAIGTDDDRLADCLPSLADLARAVGAPIVASFAHRSIDVVAAALSGPSTHLLCEPTPVERTTAFALAGALIGDNTLHDSRLHEGEAARLRRMNEEVARIAEVLSRLTRREAPDRLGAADLPEHRTVFHPEAPDAIVIDAEEVRRAIRARRMRDKFFGAGLFEEPAWDMMLDLFAAELERRRVSVSSLCIAAAVAPTTALRWISKMVDAGLFDRQPDPFDRRRAFMELSERAGRAMRDYVAALRLAGLSLS